MTSSSTSLWSAGHLGSSWPGSSFSASSCASRCSSFPSLFQSPHGGGWRSPRLRSRSGSCSISRTTDSVRDSSSQASRSRSAAPRTSQVRQRGGRRSRDAILWAAGAFTIVLVAIALSQSLPSSERTRLVFAVTDGARQKRFELDCQFNRSGRVRASLRPKGSIPAHPGGRQACEILKSLEASGNDLRSGPLNSGCPRDVALARISGIYRNKRVRARVSRAECIETAVFQDEVVVLVPRI